MICETGCAEYCAVIERFESEAIPEIWNLSDKLIGQRLLEAVLIDALQTDPRVEVLRGRHEDIDENVISSAKSVSSDYMRGDIDLSSKGEYLAAKLSDHNDELSSETESPVTIEDYLELLAMGKVNNIDTSLIRNASHGMESLLFILVDSALTASKMLKELAGESDDAEEVLGIVKLHRARGVQEEVPVTRAEVRAAAEYLDEMVDFTLNNTLADTDSETHLIDADKPTRMLKVGNIFFRLNEVDTDAAESRIKIVHTSKKTTEKSNIRLDFTSEGMVLDFGEGSGLMRGTFSETVAKAASLLNQKRFGNVGNHFTVCPAIQEMGQSMEDVSVVYLTPRTPTPYMQ